MQDITQYMKKAAERIGFRREMYVEKNLPTNIDNVIVFVFFGNPKTEVILSSLILKRIKEINPDKYFILCSRSGLSGIFPYVDEYWGYIPKTINLEHIEKQLNKFFDNIVFENPYYQNGVTQKFFDEFKEIVCEYPTIPSGKVSGNIFIYPSKTVNAWGKGKEVEINVKIEFWHELVKNILDLGMKPVIWQDYRSFDISPKFESRCNYCVEEKLIDVLGTMRSSGLVLDVFNGISRYAHLARTPFICVEDRQKFHAVKEWELDIIWKNFSSYIFSFPTTLNSGHWDQIVKTIVRRLRSFIPTLNPENYASTNEQSLVVPYKLFEEKQEKKLGIRLVLNVSD